MRALLKWPYIKAADVAEIGEFAKIVKGRQRRRHIVKHARTFAQLGGAAVAAARGALRRRRIEGICMSESILQRIMLAADFVSQNLTNRIDPLKLQVQHKRTELNAIDESLKTASAARVRRETFVAADGTDYLCPRCFIEYKRRSVLSFRPSDTSEDIIGCDNCGLTV